MMSGQAFETVPWVREASVRKGNGLTELIVWLEEYEPLGVWGNAGQLISTKGDLFTVNMAEAEEDYDLLKFGGPEGSEKEAEPLQGILQAVCRDSSGSKRSDVVGPVRLVCQTG